MCSLQLFFHKKNERPSNFPCKSLFTSHLFTHTRHASFYLKKQKYNTRIGRTRHCVVLCSYRAILLINIPYPPLRDLLIALSWVILSFWGGQKETFHHHVNFGNPWEMRGSTAASVHALSIVSFRTLKYRGHCGNIKFFRKKKLSRVLLSV